MTAFIRTTSKIFGDVIVKTARLLLTSPGKKFFVNLSVVSRSNIGIDASYWFSFPCVEILVLLLDPPSSVVLDSVATSVRSATC